ncbi:MAG TPA: patatin-like phospholipase family protein, partial [Acidimicrobiales bacterium]|nr:patatin-like phospholipase family protein [Acidimicrobiales bacterium]
LCAPGSAPGARALSLPPVPEVALVLGGGGLVGHAWHVGALAGLADATGWAPGPADLIVGTSAGAVVGAELRAGLHPSDLLRPGVGAAPTTRPVPARGPLSFRPAAPAMALRALGARAPGGLAAAGMLPRGRHDPGIIRAAIARLHPEAGPWPPSLWITAVRLADGRRVVFGREGPTQGPEPSLPPVDLPTAVAASCAMAGFFRPVPIGGADHVDGGSRSATNADLVAGGGFALVVVSSPLSLGDEAGAGPRRLVPAAARLHRLAHHRRLRGELDDVQRAGSLVLALEPDAGDVAVMGSIASSMDFARRVAVAAHARASVARRVGSSAALAPVRALLGAVPLPEP